MDIGIDRVDDIQDPDQPDKQDQAPGQHIDLGRTLLHLPVCLLVGYRGGSRHPLAELLQHHVKGLSIRIRVQRWPQLRICVRTGQLRGKPVTGQHLDAIDKAAIPHGEIALVAAQGEQHR